MAVVHPYSFVWLLAAGVAMLAGLLAVRRASAQPWPARALGLSAACALPRPNPAFSVALRRLESALGAGTPMLLELQSPD